MIFINSCHTQYSVLTRSILIPESGFIVSNVDRQNDVNMKQKPARHYAIIKKGDAFVIACELINYSLVLLFFVLTVSFSAIRADFPRLSRR